MRWHKIWRTVFYVAENFKNLNLTFRLSFIFVYMIKHLDEKWNIIYTREMLASLAFLSEALA